MLMDDHHFIDNYIANAIANIQLEKHSMPSPTFAKPSQSDDEFYFTLDDLHLLAKIAHEHAKTLGINIVLSLVDKNGLQRFYFSMPNALLVSHTLATKKAYSAVAMRMPTHELHQLLQANEPLYGLNNNTDICGIAGGLPYWCNGKLLGGIGISGGTVEQDIAIALTTINKFSEFRFSLTLHR